MRLPCFVHQDAVFVHHTALEVSRETANILLHFLNQYVGHTQSQGLEEIHFVFLTVKTIDDCCVCSLSEDRETLIHQLSIVMFLSEAEAGAVVLSTTSSEEQLKTHGPP
jgi:hypothetical protein